MRNYNKSYNGTPRSLALITATTSRYASDSEHRLACKRIPLYKGVFLCKCSNYISDWLSRFFWKARTE